MKYSRDLKLEISEHMGSETTAALKQFKPAELHKYNLGI